MSNWQEQQKRVATVSHTGSKALAQTEALKLARDEIAGLNGDPYYSGRFNDVLQKIDEALAQPEQILGFDVVIDESMPPNTFKLAQPEQEPVAHTSVFNCPNCKYPHRVVTHITGAAQLPWEANTPQRTWVGLTEMQQEILVHRFRDDPAKLAMEIEAELKEKNT